MSETEIYFDYKSPARGTMEVDKWDDTVVYRTACACSHHAHDVTTWIETKTENDIQHVTVSFIVETTISAKNIFERIKTAAKILFTGECRYDHEIMLDKKSAINFAKTIETGVQDMLQSKGSEEVR